MWFKKRDSRKDKPDEPAQDPVAALQERYSGPRYGESIETADGRVVHVDGLRTPPVEMRAELLREAGDLVKAGTTDAAQILWRGLNDKDVQLRRAARAIWDDCATAGQLSIEIPEREVRAYVHPPILGAMVFYDALRFACADEGDEAAHGFAHTVISRVSPDWVALLTRREELDGEADWRKGDPVIALGVAPWIDAAPPTLASAERLAEEVGAQGVDSWQSVDARMVSGFPTCVVESAFVDSGAKAARLHRREHVIFTRDGLLAIAGQAAEHHWSLLDPDLQVVVSDLKMPPPESRRDDPLGGLSPAQFVLRRAFQDAPPEEP